MVIGIDIGGTKILGIVFNGKKIVDKLEIVTPKTRPEFERNLLKLADYLSANRKITGIGIASAGQVNPKAGSVIISGNIKFKGEVNLVKLFKSRFRVPVKIDNDANAFTLAEMYLGHGRKLRNFLGLILGTGMGGGIVIDRKNYRGQDHSGGEFGHLVFNDEFAERKYQILRDKRDFAAAGRVIGKVLASLTNVFAPDAIIIGGGYGHNEAKKYLASAKAEMKKLLLFKSSKTKILITQIKNAGAVGAALLVK